MTTLDEINLLPEAVKEFLNDRGYRSEVVVGALCVPLARHIHVTIGFDGSAMIVDMVNEEGYHAFACIDLADPNSLGRLVTFLNTVRPARTGDQRTKRCM